VITSRDNTTPILFRTDPRYRPDLPLIEIPSSCMFVQAIGYVAVRDKLEHTTEIDAQSMLRCVRSLAIEQQWELMRLLGSDATAESAIIFVNALSPTESVRFAQSVTAGVYRANFPALIRIAIKLVREHPEFSDRELMVRNRTRIACSDHVQATVARINSSSKGGG
jgi:hypothetical protein